MATYYFKGNEAVGKQLIKALEEKGGINVYSTEGTATSLCYAIMPGNNHIVAVSLNSVTYGLLKEYGTEITPAEVNDHLRVRKGDWVLVRNNNNDYWSLKRLMQQCAMGSDFPGMFHTFCDIWRECIPYKGNETLYGTNKSAPKGAKYIYD